MRLHYLLTLIILVGLALSGSITAQASEQSFSKDQCTVTINEFMPAKQRVLTDEDGDYEDWIELYNCSDEAIDLTGRYLSDRQDRPLQWQFPSVSIPAQGYLLVWASGKDRVDGKELHTNFRIKASGEPLLLSNAAGELIDEIPPIEAHAHEVVGRSPDGVGEVMILAEPTPEASNAAAIAPALIEAPRFSHESGFYAEELALSLRHPDENVTIYCTLDGSEPDPENLQGSTYRYKTSYQQPPEKEGEQVQITNEFLESSYQTYVYDAPITIVDRSYEPDRLAHISTTIEEAPDYFPGPEYSDHWMNNAIEKTNNVIAQINRGSGNLIRVFSRFVRSFKRCATDEYYAVGKFRVVMTVPDLPYWEYTGRHLFKGTPVRAIAVQDGPQRKAKSPVATQTYFIGDKTEFPLPIIAITAPEQELFGYENGVLVAGKIYDEWLASGEAIAGIGTPSYPANWKEAPRAKGQFEIIAHGQKSKAFDTEISSHGNAARAFKTKSLRLYPQQAVDYPIFKQGPTTDFTRINLRIDRDTRLHDDISHNLLHGLAFATQRSEPYLVFLNGEYFAVLGAKDRRDATFLQHQYGLPDQDVELLSFDYANEMDVQGPRLAAKKGDFEFWDAMLEALEKEPDMPIQQINELLDLESFIDYHAAEIYMVNTDWPSNNNSFWRYTGNEIKSRPAADGKWRWILYDLDRAFRRPDTDMLSYLESDEPKRGKDQSHANKLYKLLIAHPEIRQQFIIRFADLINSTFVPERVIAFIEHMKDQMQEEMPRHIARWGAPISMGYWENHLDNMIDFARERPAAQRQHLRDYFGLGDLYTLNINVVLEDADGHQTPMDKGAIIRLNTLTLGVSDDELEKPVAASARATNMEKYLALPWSGEYFAGMPIELSVEPRAGYKFERWEGESLSRSQRDAPELELIPESDLSLKVVLSPLQ